MVLNDAINDYLFRKKNSSIHHEKNTFVLFSIKNVYRLWTIKKGAYQ